MIATVDSISEFFLNPALCPQVMTLTAGSTLFTESDEATNLYLVKSGQVRMFQKAGDGSLRLLEIIGTGQWTGCSSLFNRPTYGYGAQAASNVEVIRVSTALFNAQLAQHPEMAMTIIRQLSKRLFNAWDDAGTLVFDDCRSRLIKALIRFSETPAAARSGEEVLLRMTHEQLAQAIGVARETVSLTITDLRKENLIRTGRTQLTFNPNLLQGSLSKQLVA